MLAAPIAADPLSVTPLAGIILFPSAQSAVTRVAGLPVAARAARAAARAGLAECWLEVGDGNWRPDSSTLGEIHRLAGDMRVHIATPEGAHRPTGAVLLIAGGALVDEGAIRAALDAGAAEGSVLAPMLAIADARDARARARLMKAAGDSARHGAALAEAGRRIIAATAKPGDGIVSRHINRPISQAISRFLLGFPGFRPIHATVGTAVIGLAMLAVLLWLPGQAGLALGALLFQVASVFDGVDGEVARATFRTSDNGAMIDSLVDAATNLAFIAGIAVHLWASGHHQPALFGVAGLAMLALGLTIIGRRARASGGPFSFDGVKQRVNANGSRIGQWLTWLTMRDFYALAAMVLVLCGLVIPALIVFSCVMAVWLVVVLATGARQTA